MTVFMNGKQKRVKRPVTIDGMDVDEYIRQNADPIWLHQNEMWEYMEPMQGEDCLLSEGHMADYHPASRDAGDIVLDVDDIQLDDADIFSDDGEIPF